MEVLFVAIAVAPLVLGFHDLLVAPDPPPKALALLLLLFGLAAFAPIPFALRSSRHLAAVRFWASLAGIACATTLLLLRYTSGDYTLWQWAWWSLLVLSLVALYLTARKIKLAYLTKAKWWAAVGAIVGSATVTGLVQFWYSTYYAPLHTQPHLVVTGVLRRLSPSTKGFIPVDAHVTAKNTTGVRVQALASIYSVIGISPISQTNKSFRGTIRHDVEGSITGSSAAHFENLRTTVIQAGPLLPDDWFFDPGELYDTHFIVQVPARRHHYASIVLAVQITMAQGKRLELTNESGPTECTDKNVEACTPISDLGITAASVMKWDIPQSTWLRKYTAAKRYVLSAVVQKDPYNPRLTPYVTAWVGHENKVDFANETNRLNQTYAITFQDSFYELNFPRSNQKAKRTKTN
jgi:hypothetical protein